MIQDHRQAFPLTIYTGSAFRLWLSVRRNPAAIRQRPHDMPPCSLRAAFRFCFGNIQAAAGQILFIDPGTFCRSDHRGPKAATPPACTPSPSPPRLGPSGGLPPLRGARPGSVIQKFWEKIFCCLTTITHRKYKRFLTQCYIFVCILYTYPWPAFSHLRINGLTMREDSRPPARRFYFYSLPGLIQAATSNFFIFLGSAPGSVKRQPGAACNRAAGP